MTITTITPGYARALPRFVPFSQGVRDSLIMAKRALIKMWHTPETLIDVTVQPIIFTLMFTYIFGGAIGGDVKSYVPMLIPGILVQTVLTATATAVAGTTLREDMDGGVFDRFKSLPMARIAPIVAATLLVCAVAWALLGAPVVVPVFAPLAVDRYRRAAG